MKNLVMVVDDKPEIRNLLKMFLFDEFQVITASNGLEALEILKNGELPDSIISDIQMPDMDGKMFLQKLKLSQAFKHIPVMILSSIDNTTERIKLLRGGADEYIVKPFSPEELKVRLAKIM